MRTSRPMNRRRLALFVLLAVACGVARTADPLELHTRARVREAADPTRFALVERTVSWDPQRTAIIVCDMWDRHWCQGATARVGEMAPRMNELLKAARARGVLIVHAPSDTMKFYADYPQRHRAQQAPKTPAPPDVEKWKSLDRDKEPPLPIDDSDGGCDDAPQCAQGGPWRRQIATLEIAPEDVISDRGDEIYNVLEARGIQNVIILGVHTNMCVLGRPFSIRSMVGLGKNVLLMRDLTDTMYNSRRRPYVSHFVGTDLVVEHIEKYWCATVTSADFLGGEPFRFKADRRPRLAFIVGENEYRTWETLPEFAAQELLWRGLPVDWVTSSTRTDDFAFKDVEKLKQADLVFVSVRRRAAPVELLALLRAHLEAGKPLVGIRTASHAFSVRVEPRLPEGYGDWPGFDAEVLGGNYAGHYGEGPKTEVRVAEGAATDPILTGLDPARLLSNASLYRTRPLKPGARPLLLGSIPGRPAEPIAWTHTYGPRQAKVFYTSLGHVDDFRNPAFRRLLLNGILWALAQPVPPA